MPLPRLPRIKLRAALPAWRKPAHAGASMSFIGTDGGTPFSTRLDSRMAFQRLWRDFINARILVSLLLLLLQVCLTLVGQAPSWPIMVWCGAYLMLTAYDRGNRAIYDAPELSHAHWRRAITIDLVAYSGLLWLPTGSFYYSPLFALPVLTSAVLGSRRVALATATAASAVMLAQAGLFLEWSGPHATASLLHAGLSCLGYFFIGLLGQHLAERLVHEQQRSRLNQQTIWRLTQVNTLMIEHLDEGVIVIDAHGIVRAINPAAVRVLSQAVTDPATPRTALHAPFALQRHPAWQGLADLAARAIAQSTAQSAQLSIEAGASAPYRLLARARPTTETPEQEALCILFLQDQHEIDAQVRTAKMAALGRMSAAVAHEIRNPLAAVIQANQLLAESPPGDAANLQRLTALIDRNAQRLNRIVEDVLEVARLQPASPAPGSTSLPMASNIAGIVCEWQGQQQGQSRQSVDLRLELPPDMHAGIDAEHLRRILVNLLNNAMQHARPGPDGIVVRATRQSMADVIVITVWSEGPPISAAMQAHLFEPFFSSNSRSSGLGLYICRKLCERYGGHISHQPQQHEGRSGNAFVITLPCRAAPPAFLSTATRQASTDGPPPASAVGQLET